ncbi:MAG: hypothetical protein SGBAC_006743 [Bacillariaceae sp.]
MDYSARKNESDNNSQDASSDEEGGNKTEDEKLSGKKRSLPASEEDKKAERRAANRRSAFQSRQRRKILIEDLQRTVAGLSKENTDLRKSNEDLRVQLKGILLENHQLRMQQQMHNPNVGAADLMQASALLRGGGQNSAIAQLLGAGGVNGQLGGQAQPPSSDAPAGNFPSSSPNGDNDSILNSRLALVAAQARADELGQSQDGNNANALPPPSNAPQATAPPPSNQNAPMPGMDQNQGLGGLQSLLESARQGGLQNSLGGGGHQLNVLQGLLENSAYGGGGVPAGAMGGLAALYDSVSRAPAMGGGLNDIQRALLAGGGNNTGGISGLTAPKPGNNGNDNTVSDALRNLLQKNQPS